MTVNEATNHLVELINEVFDEFNYTDFAVLTNVEPSEDPLLQRYEKASLSADLQYIGYDVIRVIHGDDNGSEDASYLVIKPTYYHPDDFIEDVARIAIKYRIDSFDISDHNDGSLTEYDFDQNDGIFKRSDVHYYYNIDDIVDLLSNSDKNLIRSTKVKSVWTQDTKCYRINHSRDDVFDRWGHKPEYDTPLNWEPTPWES